MCVSFTDFILSCVCRESSEHGAMRMPTPRARCIRLSKGTAPTAPSQSPCSGPRHSETDEILLKNFKEVEVYLSNLYIT